MEQVIDAPIKKRKGLITGTAEHRRLAEYRQRQANWKNWGPYLSERSWGTVREDYSADGSAWEYFPHDHARSRAYRWGEDGIGGVSDRYQYICFALALWNGNDRAKHSRHSRSVKPNSPSSPQR